MPGNLPTVPTEFAGEGFNAFALVSEEQTDTARLMREQQQAEADQAEAAKRQTEMFL